MNRFAINSNLFYKIVWQEIFIYKTIYCVVIFISYYSNHNNMFLVYGVLYSSTIRDKVINNKGLEKYSLQVYIYLPKLLSFLMISECCIREDGFATLYVLIFQLQILSASLTCMYLLNFVSSRTKISKHRQFNFIFLPGGSLQFKFDNLCLPFLGDAIIL